MIKPQAPASVAEAGTRFSLGLTGVNFWMVHYHILGVMEGDCHN